MQIQIKRTFETVDIYRKLHNDKLRLLDLF